jgi:hypothetical protein
MKNPARKPVVQQETTGCGIASVAIAGLSYARAKTLAAGLGISAQDEGLWSETDYVRRFSDRLGYRAARKELPFRSWDALPDLALLAIKWHVEKRRPFWHWVVFVREANRNYVLDSKKTLRKHRRTDFGRMKPKWISK